MGFVEFSTSFFDDLVARAEESPRRRQHHNLHADYADPVQRMFNAMCMDSYIRPHRHLVEARREVLLAARGRLALITFRDGGEMDRVVPFGSEAGDAFGAELDPDQWHTILALEPGSILFEVKQGPYDPDSAKEMAPWSPPEGSSEAPQYLRQLHERAREAAARG